MLTGSSGIFNSSPTVFKISRMTPMDFSQLWTSLFDANRRPVRPFFLIDLSKGSPAEDHGSHTGSVAGWTQVVPADVSLRLVGPAQQSQNITCQSSDHTVLPFSSHYDASLPPMSLTTSADLEAVVRRLIRMINCQTQHLRLDPTMIALRGSCPSLRSEALRPSLSWSGLTIAIETLTKFRPAFPQGRHCIQIGK